MATFKLRAPSLTGSTLTLFIGVLGGAVANGAGDAMTEASGLFSATVAEALTGEHDYWVKDADGDTVWQGRVYCQGDTWIADNLVGRVLAKTDLIGTGSATTSSPVTPTGTINPIIIGDDYLLIHQRVFEWTVDKPVGFNLTDATCWFGGKLDSCNKWRVEGEITDNGDDTLTVTFELPKASTKLLKPGNYDWSVAIHDVEGNEITRVNSDTNSVTLSKKFTNANS